MRALKAMRLDLTEVENKILDDMIFKIMGAYVVAEHRYIDLVYAVSDQEGMTKEELKDYIEYLRELRLFQMDLIPVADVRPNPLDWMEWLVSGAKQDNFFEKKVTDYTHGLTGTIDYSKYAQLIKQPGLVINPEMDQ